MNNNNNIINKSSAHHRSHHHHHHNTMIMMFIVLWTICVIPALTVVHHCPQTSARKRHVEILRSAKTLQTENNTTKEA